MSAPGTGGASFSRRDLLRLAGGTAGAAGLFAAARYARPLVGGSGSRFPSLGNLAAAPTLPSKANISTVTTPAGAYFLFRSRPDLKPAATQLSIDGPGQDPGLILMDTHSGPGGQGPIILDDSGQPVWFNQISLDGDPYKRAFNLRAGEYKGKPVLSWFEGSVVNEHGEGHYVIADTSYSTVTTVEAGNGYQGDLHEFFLTPAGTAYLTAVGTGTADLTAYGGSKKGAFYYGVAQEVDVATGKVLWQWRSDQHVGFSESYSTPAQYHTEPWDYFHINCISLDSDGDIVISSRNCSAAYKVSRSTGEIIWQMGGKKSDFSFAPGAEFAWQHDVLAQPDGTITVFDNGAGNVIVQKQSRGLVLSLDLSQKRVNLVHQYLHPGGGVLADALGNLQLLPGGHAFMGWGIYGSWSEFGSAGQPLLSGRLSGKTSLSYRAFRSAWTGAPSEPPAVAAEPATGGVTVYASWNGATEVARWAVLGGDSADALSLLGVTPRAGFESEIGVPSNPAYVAVAALDAGGQQLGRSVALKV